MHVVDSKKVSSCVAEGGAGTGRFTYDLQLEDVVDLHRGLVALQNISNVFVEELESVFWDLCTATAHVGCNAIHQPYQDGLHVDLLRQLGAGVQERFQGCQVEVVWKYLDDAVHQVKLRNGIFAVDDLFKHLGQYVFRVPFLGDAVQVGKPNEVRANQQLQLLALLLPLLFLLDFSLRLHADPKPIPEV